MDIVIETPRGSIEKYNYDEEKKCFRLKKILPSGMVFPYDFGFIPDTKGEDGDPLDVLVISEYKSFPGCVIECKIIGAMLAEQTQKNKTIRNDRFFAVPVLSTLYGHFKSPSDIPRDKVHELEAFFINYNKAEGKKFKPLELVDAKKAMKLLLKSDTGS